MGNLLNWQTWELCLGKAPKKKKSASLKRSMYVYYKISTNIIQDQNQFKMSSEAFFLKKY